MNGRSDIHLLSVHDGSRWLEDSLVQGDFGAKLAELLGGIPQRRRVLIPHVSQAFYYKERSAVVMTFRPEIDWAAAKRMVEEIRQGREDTN